MIEKTCWREIRVFIFLIDVIVSNQALNVSFHADLIKSSRNALECFQDTRMTAHEARMSLPHNQSNEWRSRGKNQPTCFCIINGRGEESIRMGSRVYKHIRNNGLQLWVLLYLFSKLVKVHRIRKSRRQKGWSIC